MKIWGKNHPKNNKTFHLIEGSLWAEEEEEMREFAFQLRLCCNLQTVSWYGFLHWDSYIQCFPFK